MEVRSVENLGLLIGFIWIVGIFVGMILLMTLFWQIIKRIPAVEKWVNKEISDAEKRWNNEEE